MQGKVILVNENDNQIGLEEKIKAHEEGRLHRAISVYIFNSKGQLMMQQRSKNVYHSGLLWSNTCCTNCYEGESTEYSAHRSLKGEMGFDCSLKEEFSTIYKADVGNNMTEHEFLHVFFGRYDGDPKINKDEVADWKWMDFDALVTDSEMHSEIYTKWLLILLEKELPKFVKDYLSNEKR